MDLGKAGTDALVRTARMKPNRIRVSHENFLELLAYDKADGTFRWHSNRSGRVKKGDIAGSLTESGYTIIRIGKDRYPAHRLAWFYVYGFDSEFQIDHRNKEKSDNSIDNLREATHGQNITNQPLRSNNRSGFKGVSYHRHAKKWVAKIMSNRKVRCLGYFDDPKTAHDVYCTAARDLHGEYRDEALSR